MQKINYLIAAFAVLSLGSCKKFLDKQPLANNTIETFYKTPSDAVAATNSSYEVLKWDGTYNRAMWVTDMMSGESTASDPSQPQVMDVLNNRASTANSFIYNVYKAYYTGIYRTNVALEKIPTINFGTDTTKNRLLAENRFLRALYHFNLVRHFGDVPLVVSYQSDAAASFNIPRSPVATVLAAVIEDLKFAEQYLPTSKQYSAGDQGRATKGAAQGLLTRVYLHANDWANASSKANDIISSGDYGLYDDYADNFYGIKKLARANNGANKESLFEVQFRAGGGGWAESAAGYWGNEYFGPSGCGCNLWYGFNWNIPRQTHADTYEAGDKRKFINIFSIGDDVPGFNKPYIADYNPNTGHNIKKWFSGKSETQGLDAPTNIPVIRYSDVILMKAEADARLNNFGSATTLVNQIRKRAGLADVTLTSANALDAILHERRVELAFESVFWFDIIRFGKASEIYKENTGLDLPSYRYLWPIPQTERDLVPALTQNPAY